MGEAVHLTEEERIQVIKIGKTLIEKYDPSIQIIAGTGAQSARATIKLTQDAAQAGATCALILPPSFYKGNMDQLSIIDFFTKVADQSPIPIIIYNYPGVTQGLDIDVETLTELSKHKNIIGVKGTEGNIGKVGYLAEYTKDFALIAGSADFFLPALIVGASGVIAGLANFLPRSCVELLRLYQQEDYKAAANLQRQLVLPDNAVCRWYGVPGVKAALDHFVGYGGPSRSPLRSITQEQKKKLVDTISSSYQLEQSLKK
ncbi:unnamed protein product [Cunninghamella blakesleeana]